MQHRWISDHDRTEKHEQSPFIYPSCSQILAHLQWWKAQKKKTLQKRRKRIFKDQQNKKILQFSDTLQKSHVSYSFKFYCVRNELFLYNLYSREINFLKIF